MAVLGIAAAAATAAAKLPPLRRPPHPRAQPFHLLLSACTAAQLAQGGAAGVSGAALLQALQSVMAGGAAAAAGPPAQQQPAAAPPAAAPPAAGAGVSGAALLQALQQVMGGVAAAAPPAAAQQQAAAHQPQGAAPAAAAAPRAPGVDKYAATARPSSPAPAWTKAAASWTVPAAPPDHAILPSAAAAAQGSPVQQACSTVLGQAVALGTAPGGGGGAVHLLLVPAAQPAGALKLTAAAVDTAVGRIPPGSSLVLALQAAWLRAAEALAAPEGAAAEVAAVLRLWQARLAHKAAQALATDEDDDLFFAGGRQRGAFLQALVRAGLRGRCVCV